MDLIFHYFYNYIFHFTPNASIMTCFLLILINLHLFLYITLFYSLYVLRKVSNDVLSSLLYTSGYVAQKVLFKIQCDECKDLLDCTHIFQNKLFLFFFLFRLDTRNAAYGPEY